MPASSNVPAKHDTLKANFGNCYSDYSPEGYVRHLVEKLGYQTPFHIMPEVKKYSRKIFPEGIVRLTILGGAHGIDSAVLKYAALPEQIIERWTNSTSRETPFPASDTGYDVTLIDIEPEPLRFAANINLADRTFTANLCQPYPEELQKHLSEHTDVISAGGVTSYIGTEGMEKILRTCFMHGNVKALFFSVLKYLEVDKWRELCQRYGLRVYELGNFCQRRYKDEDEKERISNALLEQGTLDDLDKEELMSRLFLAVPNGLSPGLDVEEKHPL